jgi:hypothetical protein
MSRNFWNHFSPSSKAIFGVLSPPKSPDPSISNISGSPSDILGQAGSDNLSDVIKRRDNAQLFTMGHVDELGRPSLAHTTISNAIKDFFLSDTARLEVHRGTESSARRPSHYFDIRQVGTTNNSLNEEQQQGTAEPIQIFCCRYGEEIQSRAHARNSLTLAIPASAGLKAPEAVSLINPLSMLPREYINEGEAGAILCYSPSTHRCVADLYWTHSAFMHSLNQVQTIGRTLIEMDAIKEAADTGIGVVDIHRASAILAKLYEAVAQVGQTTGEPFFSAGVWGVAVLPQRDNTYQCLVGVVALNVPHISETEQEQLDSTQTLFLSKRNFAIATFRLYRDDFGFLKIRAEECKLHPLKPIPWFDRLPAVA